MVAQESSLASPANGKDMSAANTTPMSSMSTPNHRPFGRASTFADSPIPARHRLSSNVSDSTRHSFRSSTDDLFLPRAKSPDIISGHEPSHWHSVPLALALLPALGGLFFRDGSVIVTDLTLLILAAIFLNWAVRLPWDWYLSAQSIRADSDIEFPDDYPPDTIMEEGSEEEGQESCPSSPNADRNNNSHKPATSAAQELRIHELLALLACFISPVIGAWLLHHIRGQLSRPSEGLVSDYNLTIFLLASELRPVSHLIKMVQARTLHLQRTLAANPHSQTSSELSPATVQDLKTRLAELEAHVADTASNGINLKAPPADLTTQLRKSVQPDFDALNRAVRRYEKRTTLLSLQTEHRLQELEKRLGDAITLAAAAERWSQSNIQRRSSGLGLLFDWISTVVYLPFQVGWKLIAFPGTVLVGAVSQAEDYVGQKIKRELRTAGRGDVRAGSGGEKRRGQSRGQKKAV